MRSVPFAPLEPALYREAVRRALAEDLGWGDVTTEATVDASLHALRKFRDGLDAFGREVDAVAAARHEQAMLDVRVHFLR